MHTQYKENIAIVTAGLFTSVALMHLIRVLFNVDLSAGGVILAPWLSGLAFIVIGALAILNLKIIENRSKATWLKFVMILFLCDALVAFYSWFANLNYWGLSHSFFGWGVLFDLVVIFILLYFLPKKSK
ncbi:MAG: hypothetical protein Q8P11_02495 [bacterium]|nr:hypothetical protein [bacterium]